MRYVLLLGLGALLPSMAFAQNDESTAALKGPVTRFVSLSDFDISGQKVTILPKTRIRLYWPDGSSVVARPPARLFLGEHAAVYQADTEGADRVDVTQPSMHAVEATATVEAVQPGADLEVQADGYRICITGETKVTYEKPYTATGDIKPGAVLKYKGMLQKDGTVLASSAVFHENEVTDAALAARKAWEYDPAAVATESRQSLGSRMFRGDDARLFPLHADAAVQARIEAIGEKLIPAYQKAMGPDSKASIHFRFYVVDGPKDAEANYALPSGIILVPFAVVQKLPEDAQLAAVLADAIASLIEAQPLALAQTNGQIAKKAAVGVAEGMAIGSVGSGILNARAEEKVRKDAEQRARVSLTLMRDASFDITAAPQAWWALSRDASQPLDADEPPTIATYLYGRIAEMEAVEAGALVGKKR
jgi:hypothetical protein